MSDEIKQAGQSEPSRPVADKNSARCDGVSEGEFAASAQLAFERMEVIGERWLIGPVAAAYDAMKTDRSRAISVDAAFSAIRARHEKLTNGK